MVFFSAMKNNEIIAEKPFPNTSAVPKGGQKGQVVPPRRPPRVPDKK